jgi:photosystem II stability/assembly factor-like uncharacterized protein
MLFVQATVKGQLSNLQTQTLSVNTNIRGLSVVDDKVAWFGGSNGYTGLSTNGGKDWKLMQVKGFEKSDFRSVYAFDAKNAVIANAGTPANILRTEDGGTTWNIVYTNIDSAAFVDGIDFWNKDHGLVYGDPIDNKLLLLTTNDGGKHWLAMPDSSRPVLKDHEASFAASGTCIRCFDQNSVMIATGGEVSRLFRSLDGGITWATIHTPMLHGRATAGTFSFAKGKEHIVLVGGDYTQDTLKTDHVFYAEANMGTWLRPLQPTRGYRECVEFINKKTLIAVGPSGFDISRDKGESWTPFSDERSFHVIRKSRKGNLVIAAGKGKIAVIDRSKR